VTVHGNGPWAGSTFDLCPVAGSDCTDGDTEAVTGTTDEHGTATFPGRYLPGAYRILQTGAPAGQSFDTTPHLLVVGAAHTLTERDTPALLTLGDPVPDPVTPVSTPTTSPTATGPTATSPTATGAPATSEVATQTIAAGKKQTVSIGGFQPHETVHGVLHSTPVDLGTVAADDAGVATFTFTVPAGLEGGAHSVTMTGLTSGTTAEATFTVTAAAQGAGDLAYTGADVLPLLAVGGGLLLTGATAVTVAGRRRSA
jgi:hypothetical protein